MKRLTLILSMLIALVGLNANAAMYIVGTTPFGNWDPSKGVEMELQNDGSYKLDATLTTDATIYFVFAEAIGDWNAVNGNRWDPGTGADLTVSPEVEFTAVKGNTDKSFKFSGTIGEKYTFTFNRATGKGKVSGYVEPITEFTYTVAGNSAAIFGEEWNTTLTDNDMTLDETDGLYKLVKNGVEISSGFTLLYKVVENHSWGNNWGKPNGDNQDYYFDKSGIYNLTFTFNLGSGEVGLIPDPVQEGPDVNPLTGELFMMGHVNGNGWAGNVGAAMATEDGNIFTLTNAAINDSGDGYGWFSFTSKLGANADDWSFNDYRRGALEDGTVVEAGVAATLASWGTSYAFKALAGTYDITVNLTAGTVLLVAKEAPQPEVDDVYIIGDVNEMGWAADKGVKMNYNEETKVYTANITTQKQENLEVGYIEFSKMLADSANGWDDIAPYRFGPVCEGENWVMTEELLGQECALALEGYSHSIAIPAGTWTVTVNLETAMFTINGEWPVVEPEHYDGDVYILGEVNNNGGWFPNVGVKMTRDAENNVYTATITTAGENVNEGEEIGYSYFSFTKKLAENDYENGGWDEINNGSDRFGAVTDGDPFLVTEELLGQNLSLEYAADPHAFKIPAGEWNLTLSVDNKTLVIEKVEGLRGDVNNDKSVTIGDVTALIDYLLSGSDEGVNVQNANCNLDEGVTIGDVTALIDFLLSGNW